MKVRNIECILSGKSRSTFNQWYLWIKDTLGLAILSSIERFYSMKYCYGKGVHKCVLCSEVVPFLRGPFTRYSCNHYWHYRCRGLRIVLVEYVIQLAIANALWPIAILLHSYNRLVYHSVELSAMALQQSTALGWPASKIPPHRMRLSRLFWQVQILQYRQYCSVIIERWHCNYNTLYHLHVYYNENS